jgi:hypothetical protein
MDGIDMLGKSLGVKDTSERSHWGREVKELERGGAERAGVVVSE